MLADVGQHQRHAAAALGQLERRIDRPADAFHVVLDPQQEARDQLAPLGLAGVEEGGRRGLEAAGEDFLHQRHCLRFVPAGERQGDHDDTVLEAFEIPFPVAGLQRVAGVVFERAQEGRKAELDPVGRVPDAGDEGSVVLFDDRSFVIAFLDQIAQLFLQRVEEDGVLVDVLQEILPRRHAVGIKADLSLVVVEIQHRVQRVIVEALPFGGDRLGGGGVAQIAVENCVFQNLSSPSVTRAMSVAVPASSNR